MSSAKEKERPTTPTDDLKMKLTAASAVVSKAVAPAIAFVSLVFPYIVQFFQVASNTYSKLPTNAISALVGLIFCFFGGVYPTLFAAIQAAKHSGGEKLIASIKDLSNEVTVILEASKKDDEIDADGDGIADVNQIDGKALIMRKTGVVLEKCNPDKINTAVGYIYVTWMAVVVTLKVDFARTIALALSISSSLRAPSRSYIEPTLAAIIPAKYNKWVPVILDWTCKSIAMSIAWYIQTIISAFTSATYGGLKFSRSLLKFCNQQGWTFGGILPKDHRDTSIDEIFGWMMAALGFYFQYKMGFDVPFPFNIVLWPLETAEWYIRWTITSE